MQFVTALKDHGQDGRPKEGFDDDFCWVVVVLRSKKILLVAKVRRPYGVQHNLHDLVRLKIKFQC